MHVRKRRMEHLRLMFLCLIKISELEGKRKKVDITN